MSLYYLAVQYIIVKISFTAIARTSLRVHASIIIFLKNVICTFTSDTLGL